MTARGTTHRPVVAVVGGGASGVLTSAHLARRAELLGRPLHLLLVEPDVTARGVAYRTGDPRHRLNVPASGMSAWPDDPDHFLRWLRRHVAVDFPASGFAPRVHYRDYLLSVLDESIVPSGQVALENVAVRATDVRPHGRRLRVVLADGTSRPADAVVLATGYDPAGTGWAPAALRSSDRFVADPWSAVPEHLAPRPGDEVLLVGAGLTAVDMAMTWTRTGVRTHVVSRHGGLPLAHAREPRQGTAPPALPGAPVDLRSATRYVVGHLRSVLDAGGDWRSAVDGLRPVTQQLWSRMSPDARRAFLRSGMRRWDRLRHRVDPAVGAWLDERVGEGALVPHVGRVTGAREVGDVIEVTLSDGATVRASAVVNCTGAGCDVAQSQDPLFMNLRAAGVVVPDPLAMGVVTDAHGRVTPATGRPVAMWAVGPLRKGGLWESVAVPELRVQAHDVARAVVEVLPSPSLRRRPRDPYGLPLSTTSTAAVAYVEALGRILRVQSGAERLVAEAVASDPGFALGHAVHALLGAEWGVHVDVDAALDRAIDVLDTADERERRFVEAAYARVRTPGPAASAALLAYIHAYPEDALAVSLAVPTIAFGGATEVPAEAWALVEGLAPAYGQNWWYLGMLAFIRQEQDRFGEAGELAARALAIEPAAGHAVHAKAHVHYETGDHRAGLAWLDRWITTCGARASHRAHFSWHAALHELALGDDAAVRRRYATQLAPPTVDGVRALVDSASLLWRARLAGAGDTGDVRTVLGRVPVHLLADPPTAFVGLHAAVALAAAGDCGGLARLRRAVQLRPDPVLSGTVAELADALIDLVHDDVSRAADRLAALAPGVSRLGGSAAQQGVVEDTLLYALVASRRTQEAREILDRRLHRRASPRDERLRRSLVDATVSAAGP